MNGDAISDSVHFERGYNKGFEAGCRRAFELIGELADFYENGVGIDEDTSSEEEKREHKRDRQLQTNACRYAQVVIRQNDFTDADLPW